MKKYIKSTKDTEYDIDEFHQDMIFGEPMDEVLDIDDFFDYLEDAIRFADESFEITSTTEIYATENSSNERIYVTSYFEQGIKELIKKHRQDVLKELKDIIERLLRLEITRRQHNHPLKSAAKHMDIHIDGGRLILIYKYMSKDVFAVSLKLQDIVDHKELNNYDVRKYSASTKETTIDEIFKN